MFGLVGKKLGHSFSPYIHKQLGGYDYSLWEMDENALESFFKERSFSGVNVTVPYKEAVIEYLDELSAEAEAIGAVNTVVNKGGKLIGYNTDCCGMKELILREGVSLLGKKVLVLGSGGTSKTARFVATELGAASVLTVSRGVSKGCITYSEATEMHCDAHIIINTTPCGMYPEIGKAAIDIKSFPNLEAVVDVVYNPLKSKLVCDALANGVKAVGGLYMLVSQAAKAAELFADLTVENSKVEAIYKVLYKQKENIVLVGMPGSGKTTLGKELAIKLGKSFVDSDEEVTKKTGLTPAEIISQKGEAHFRAVEAEIIKELSATQNAVIATGGGAVLKLENVELLKENGIIVFIDRPLNDIMPTHDRPLSSDRKALEERYKERYGIYSSCCDFRVENIGKVEETLNKIIKEADYEDIGN